MRNQVIVFSDTYEKWHVGQLVATPRGNGVIAEIRDNCKFPMFVELGDGLIDAFPRKEISAI